MSTNYRVTTPKEFFDRKVERENENSLFDQLGSVLKSSLNQVWNYVKTIDVKASIQQGLEGNGLGLKQPKLGIDNNNKSQSNNIQHHHQSTSFNTSLNQETLNKESLSKREKLKEKKERKKISFEEYEQEQEKKINESFIKRNIEIKKALNRSLQSIQQQREEQLGMLLLMEKINEDNGNNNNHSEQKERNHHKEEQIHTNKVSEQLKNINHNNHNNQNESLILNISDIDSECNFNILNSSQLNESSSMLKDEHLRGEFLREGQEEEDGIDGVNEGLVESNVPRLELKEYPFLGHAARMTYRAKQSSNNRNDSRKNSVNYTKNNNKSKEKISTTNEQQYDQFDNNYIDVDALYYPPLEHNPKKRIAAPFIKSNETQIRKKVKHNQQQNIVEGEKITAKMLEKQEKFDRLVASRYEKIIENLNGEKEEDREQRLTLKEEYEKFLQKNFAPANYLKQKLSKEDPKQKEPAQKLKFSEYLKQVNMTPEIERKKLYNFTKECESKISIREELRKSVLQDKEKQYMEEMKRKQEEEMRKKREEEELRRRQEEELRRRQDEERRQKQQEELRLAEELKKQQSQPEEGQQQNELDVNKTVETNQSQLEQKPQTEVEKVPIKEVIASPKGEEEKEKTEKEPAKPFSLFGAPKTSLFSLAEKKPSEEKLPETSTTPKEEELTKKPSIIEGKSTEEVKVKEPVEAVKSVELVSKPSETEVKKKPEGAKHNPFLAPVKTPNVTLLQEIINSKKDDASVFKSTISSTPLTSNSPQRQPPTVNPNSFLSPVHNTSQYSNLDSSMCEESESNITPGNSQVLQNSILPGNNLNGSFLNASFSSHTGSVFPGNSASLFNGPTGGSSGMFNTSSFNPSGQTSGLFGNAQSQAPSGGLFGNQQQQPGGFMSAAQSAQAAKFEAINKVPSFMQNQPSIIPTVSPQTALNLFSQRSPSKNEPQSSLFGPTPSQPPKPTSTRRNQRKEERIR